MLNRLDDLKKSARERARRRWQNYQVEKDFKKAQQKEADGAAIKPKPLSPADVIEQERIVAEATTRFESKFIKEIRAMLDEHKEPQFGFICTLNSGAAQKTSNGEVKAVRVTRS
jgi:hypothetical protein